MMSATVTSLTVVLIVVFLFKEGIGVFGHSPIEEEYVIGLNSHNNIKKVNAEDVKNIFDAKIIYWNEIEGRHSASGRAVPEDSIITFRLDDITNYYSEEELGSEYEHLGEKINELVEKTPGIIAYFPKKYLAPDFNGRLLPLQKITLTNFLAGKEWFPTAHPAAQLGVLPLILGTLWVSLGAILIALPLGLATAIYMAEIANEKTRRVLKPIIELLAGIPSVVYGFFGLVVIVPLIQQFFNLPVGETGLAGSIILGIMALPTIITISEDALRTTPRAMKEASLALGATKWQTIYRVVVPYSSSGISAAAILGIGRAIGETMAVLMVTGNASIIPHTLLEPLRTIPATIAAELGEAQQGGLHYQALFALGCILFIMTLIVNLSVEFVASRKKHSKR